MNALKTAILLLAVSLSGCTSYYVPNTQNVPLFKEKNEFRISATKAFVTTEVQAAYSVTHNIAVMANFMRVRDMAMTDPSWGRENYIESAIGYYTPFMEKGVFEIYGGCGFSNQYYQYSYFSVGSLRNSSGTASFSFTKFFIQPSVGFTSGIFDFAFSARLSNLHYYKINSKINVGNSEYSKLDLIRQNTNSFVFEPAFTTLIGFKYVKIQLQSGVAINLNNPNSNFQTPLGSLGLQIAIPKKFWKQFEKNKRNK
jgi:hypothetical protein